MHFCGRLRNTLPVGKTKMSLRNRLRCNSEVEPHNLTFDWSLKPMLMWMQLIGFQLNRPSGKSESGWVRFTGSCIVLVNIILHVASFGYGIQRLKNSGLGPNVTNLTTAYMLNHGIEHLNYTCVLIGVHIAFFVVVLLTHYWQFLWDTLKTIEQTFCFKPKFYRRCRRIAVIGSTLFILDCGTYLYMSMTSSYWLLGNWRPLAILLSNVTRAVVLSIMTAVCILVRCTSVVFEVLNQRIDALARLEPLSYLLLTVHHQPSSNSSVLAIRMEKWRRNHARACQLVDHINQCFGAILLFTVTNGSVSFITTSFEIVRSFQENNSLPSVFVMIFIKKMLLLGMILYEPYQLQFQAAQTIGLLRRLHHPSADLITQSRLNTIILEVAHSSPKITAMEFFDVNLRLIPTIIGTTLTYVAILCQASAYASQW